MSHHRGVLGASLHHPLPIPTHSKSKRLRTKRERNAAKFGPKVSLGGSRQGPAARPRWLQPPLWRALPLGSPLRHPKPVVITQNRLRHRGLFNREVKSLDVRRLLSPGPGGDGPPPAPQTEEGDVGGLPAEGLRDLVASLATLLRSFGAFVGRELLSERRRSLMTVLRRHRQGPPDLGVFLAHRTPAQLPGQRSPRQGARSGPPGRAVSLAGWEVGDPPAGTPSPLRAVHTPPPPPRPPSPIFGAPRETENPFSWSSAEDEDDEAPGGLTQAWGGPGGLPPAPPPFWRSPKAPQEEEGGDEGWAPIAPPAFNPDPLPWGAPQPRDTRGPPPRPQTLSEPPNLGNRDPLGPPSSLQVPLERPKSPLGLPGPTPDPPQTPLGTPRPHPSSPDAPQTRPGRPNLEPGVPQGLPGPPQTPLGHPEPLQTPVGPQTTEPRAAQGVPRSPQAPPDSPAQELGAPHGPTGGPETPVGPPRRPQTPLGFPRAPQVPPDPPALELGARLAAPGPPQTLAGPPRLEPGSPRSPPEHGTVAVLLSSALSRHSSARPALSPRRPLRPPLSRHFPSRPAPPRRSLSRSAQSRPAPLLPPGPEAAPPGVGRGRSLGGPPGQAPLAGLQLPLHGALPRGSAPSEMRRGLPWGSAPQ
ncbi:basic salivary proline-rich protein 1-like [Chamaea fasciata]|uniref:basic salivary proline-rich protein 1-like n=1 Tax=Chamaea fasciata TaxID=190680 RepID=UPI00336A75A8